MLPEKQIKLARNLLTLAMVHDAQKREPEIFKDRLESYHAIFATGLLYWLFGEEGPEHPCSHHEASNFDGFLVVMAKRLKAAGYPDPESPEPYHFIKACMAKCPGMGLFAALSTLTAAADIASGRGSRGV